MPQIVIYTKTLCPYCIRAIGLLKKKRVNFKKIDVGMNSEKRAEMIERSGGRKTVPQIFIGDKHIGGCDDMFALERAGKLDEILGL